MDSTVKLGLLALTLVLVVSFIVVKPLVYHEDKYRVVIANTSEHTIANVALSGAGIDVNNIGPILVGQIQDYIFIPPESGALRYVITQNNQTLEGIVNSDLKKGEMGDIFIVIGEMYKVKIHDDYGTDYFLSR